MAFNVHRVFKGPEDVNHYLKAITLPDTREIDLKSALKTCRDSIREGLGNWTTTFQKSMLFESASIPNGLRPKFRMQGSFAYRTHNAPAQTPPQEIDIDDDIFTPVSFLTTQGRHHPSLISSGYFAAVEALLLPVCKENDWKLITDKPSCIRVALQSNAHIDFALYAIPDDEFELLTEAARSINKIHGATAIYDSVEFSESLYQDLSEDQIMLAHREEGWKPSDPRKLEIWFKGAIEIYGEQLRRVSRYLKGWRDHSWLSCRLSSIALMACAVAAYRESSDRPKDGRDDLALLMVADRLPDLLSKRIRNPVIDDQFLDEGWTRDERNDFVAVAKALRNSLNDSLYGTGSKKIVHSNLVRAFGERIPEDFSLIISEGAEIGAPTILTAGLIKDMAAGQAPQSAVQREGDRRYG